MKTRFFTSALLMLMALTASARDIHGVKGYWNFTAAQMQADGFVTVDPNTGNKLKPLWLPAISFQDGYLTDTLGVGGLDDNTKASEKSWWRSTVYINKQAKEANINITKDYPIVMFKFSLPKNAVIEGDATRPSKVTVEHWWKSPYDGTTKLMTNKTGEGVNGIASNGRMDYMTYFPGFKCELEGSKLLGRDSVKIGWEGNHTKYLVNDAGVVYASRNVKVPATKIGEEPQQTLQTWTMGVLPDGSDECNYFCIINYGSIEDTLSVDNGGAASRLLLDRTNIESIGFHIMFFGFKTIADCDEAPYAKVKWMKTFASYEDAMNALTADNNWGDGNESDAKTQLNYQLYYAEQDLAGFIWRNLDPQSPDDEAYLAYKKTYEEANAIYEKVGATDAEYEAAVAALREARTTLLAQVDLPEGMLYNYVNSATGSGALVMGADEVTIGNLTGKPLTIGASDAATAMSFVPAGLKINGQNAYRLVAEGGEVVQAADGTLLVVADQTGSNFTFAERDKEGQGYDMMCGEYYYYKDVNGQFAATKQIVVDATDYDAIASFLFTLKDALPDYASKASEDAKTGLKDGWEFNEAAVDDPGTKGFYEEQEMTMSEYGATKMIEGWRMSRWRMWSRVNQETVEYKTDSILTCLALTSAATYDTFDGAETGIENTFNAPAALRMDGGTEEPFYARDPNPRDDTYGYYINPGFKRYFAVKMLNTEDVTFGNINIFNGLTGKGIAIDEQQLAGKKGDVYYWDLLSCGFPIGKQLFTAAFLSPTGFTSVESKMLIDWIRFYDTIDNIPEETFVAPVVPEPDGISSIEASSAQQLFDLAGRQVKAGKAGLYIVKTQQGAKKVIMK